MVGGTNFFEWQDKARRRTTILVFYFVLAVAAIVAVIYLSIAVLLSGNSDVAFTYGYWNPGLFAAVAGGVLFVILSGTLYKISELSGPAGGMRVATMLGGRLVNTDTRDPDERKLLNVVEEMAIASGIPVPPVFVLDEEGINAFAAGYSTQDAVIAVTKGALKTLSRDELQGVVAHEFSHVFNGDMRLNIRLIAVLHGIILLALAGATILRVVGRAGAVPRRRSRRDNTAGFVLVLMAVAVVLVVVGYVGEFFARLIQAAVSRQREFLADASAVQFTRNPSGLAGALKKIAVAPLGSRLTNTHARAASHLFFADSLKRFMGGMFSTHPDINERIRRLDPTWDPRHPVLESKPRAETSAAVGTMGVAAGALRESATGIPAEGRGGGRRMTLDPARVVNSIGALAADHVQTAGQLIGSIPEPLLHAAREPFGSRAVVFALLLDRDSAVREAQLARLRGHADPPTVRELERLLPLCMNLSPAARLPLLEIALQSLRALSPAQWVALIDNVDYLIQADARVSVFELALRVIVRGEYRRSREVRSTAHRVRSLSAALPSVQVLLSMLAWAGSGGDRERARYAYARACERLSALSSAADIIPAEALGVTQFERAVEELAGASPMVKRWVMDACAICVAADGTVRLEEAELLRAVGAVLDCPVPPFAVSADSGDRGN